MLYNNKTKLKWANHVNKELKQSTNICHKLFKPNT